MSEINQNTIGNLKISEDVLATIAQQATIEVKGVAKLTCENTNLSGLLAKATRANPIQVQLSEDSAVIDVSIKLLPNTSIPEVSGEVQRSVKSAIQNMTGIAVSKVNIVVQGIEFSKEA